MALALCLVVCAAAAAAAVPARGGESQLCLGQPATIVGDEREVFGTKDADVIVAEREAYIYAKQGDDLICLYGPDYHFVVAGSGNDRIAGSPGYDDVVHGRGDDYVALAGDVDVISGLDPSGDDILLGGDGRDVLTFEGRQGVRVDLERGIARGLGRDRIGSFSTIVGTKDRDVIRGDDASNRILGLFGGDRISGRGGRDTIIGSAEPEQGAQGPGDDLIRGGPGEDRLISRGGSDEVDGGPGDDFLRGGSPGERPGDLAIGGGGRDRCTQFERSRACERS